MVKFNCRIEHWFHATVIDRPRSVLLVMLCLALLFAWFIPEFRLDASADSLLLENDRDLKVYREITRRYDNRDLLILTFTPNDDLFEDKSLALIGQLRGALEELDGVESVLSILDAPLVGMSSTSLSELAQNVSTLEDKGVDRDRAREDLIESPIFKQLIISEDGTTTALVISLPVDREFVSLTHARDRLREQRADVGLRPEQELELEQLEQNYLLQKQGIDQRNHNTIAAIRTIMKQHQGHGELHLGGISMIADDMISYIGNDLERFGIGVFVFLILMLSIIFRRFRWVLLPLVSCIYSGLIMIGFLGMVNWPVTVISSNFISLMLIMTMSMNIHLIVRYRELARDNPSLSQIELVTHTARRMVRPCLFTALTTMIGFTSLVVSQIKPVIHFGLMMSIGLAVTFLTTFILFPALLLLFKREAIGPNVIRNRVTPWLGRLTERHGATILVACLLAGIVSGIGMGLLRVENSFINYFSEDTEIHRGQILIDEKLGGTTPLDVILQFEDLVVADEEEGFEDLDALFGDIKSDPADSWFTEERLDRITQVHDYLQQQPAVGKVLSLASFLKLMQQVNNGQKTDAFEMALVYKRMPDNIRASLVDPYISIEDKQARINMRIIDSLPDLRRKEFLEQIASDLETNLGIAPQEYQLTGMLILYNNMLQSLFRSQILTLGAVMLGIALMLWLLFRSIQLAFICILPNLLAAVVILGLMGLLEIPLDMMTITIAAITIGIAVDDCIHYIYRFREEFARRKNYRRNHALLPCKHWCCHALHFADNNHWILHPDFVKLHSHYNLWAIDDTGDGGCLAGRFDIIAEADITRQAFR